MRNTLITRKASAEEIARSDAKLAARGPSADKLLRDNLPQPKGPSFRYAIAEALEYRYQVDNLQGGSGHVKALRGEV